MSVVIVTGLSGAGKSRAMDILEDIGYYCIDNMPPKLIPTFLNLYKEASGETNKVAFAADIRSKDFFGDLFSVLDGFDKDGTIYRILFMDCSDEELVRRYELTRRKHPLSEKASGNIKRAVEMEREPLNLIRAKADYVVDTSFIEATQLKARITDLFLEKSGREMRVYCQSFGFKYGSPNECDLVFDVRCIPNPYYVDELRELTGLDNRVSGYVMSFDDSQVLQNKLNDMIDFLYPLYVKEGKSQLVIGIGCSGGKHRSVTFTENLAKHLSSKGRDVVVTHRDIEK